MNNQQLTILCNLLSLGKQRSFPRKVHGGLLHLMWKVTTDKGSYAIKQLSKNINLNRHIRNQYELTERIASTFKAHGIPAITSLTTKDGLSLVDAGNHTFIAYPWIDAKALDSNEVSAQHTIKIAQLLAKMHALNLQFPELTTPGYDVHANDKIMYLIQSSINSNASFAKNLKKKQKLLIDVNSKYQRAIVILSASTVVAHGDMDQKNVLWDLNNNPILIDWESARLINSTQETLNAALDWSGITTGNLDIDIFTAMIVAYKKAGGVIDLKVLTAAFYAILGNWLNWMIYNIERSLTTEQSAADEQYRGIEQVHQVLKSIIYLEDKIEELTTLVNDI